MRPYIGGQAVLEGVMMRAPSSFAVVVRRADGSLHVRERAMVEVPRGIWGWPLIRGVATLVESLRMGSEALRFSVEQAEADMQTAAARGVPPLNVFGALGLAVAALSNDDGAGSSAQPAASDRKGGAGGIVMLAIAIAFFVALPQLAAAGINRLLGLGLPVQSAAFQAITGVLKLAIVVGYMVTIRRIPEIRRVFQYHGAEHKTISTYEAGEALTVANARAKTTLHPRCGTTFLVMVAIVSIVMFTLLGALLPRIATGSAVLDNVLFFAAKLPFLPVLVAVTFELQRVFARYFTSGPLRVLLWPGFWVQKITTAEPDDTQLEVALASLRVTLFRMAPVREANEGDVRFADYEALVCADSLR
ncbi:MAG TPA: DUF1385 domain-containing protein [Polyangiaceae bacterium]|nr:DUF1385 domain-containing protein [Polyangiaceae bacterium]